MCIHKHKLKVADTPLGEPIKDILSSVSDGKWSMYVWCLSNVNPLRKPIPLEGKSNGSSWTRVQLSETEPLSKNLEAYF